MYLGRIFGLTANSNRPANKRQHANEQTGPPTVGGSSAVLRTATTSSAPHRPTAWPVCVDPKSASGLALRADGVPYFPPTHNAATANVSSPLIAGIPGSVQMTASLHNWLKQHEAVHMTMLTLGMIQGGRLVLSAVRWVRQGSKKYSKFIADIGPHREARVVLQGDVKFLKVAVYTTVPTKDGPMVDEKFFFLPAV